jgi:hypothetical protein
MVNTTSLLSGGSVFDDKMFLKVSQSWSISSWSMMDYAIFLSLYSKKVFFDYSLGGYSHRERWARTRRYFLVKHWSWRSAGVLFPSGASFTVEETRSFSVKIWLRHEILELRYRNATRMPWLVMKVRPRDPSCVAWYTHMDALCWYVSVSTTQRKSWWTHCVPWEPLGFILCKS